MAESTLEIHLDGLPFSEVKNVIETEVFIETGNSETMKQIQILLEEGPSNYSMSILRPTVSNTLQSCSNEKMSILFYQPFSNLVDLSLKSQEGPISIGTLSSTLFTTANAITETGSISVDYVICTQSFISKTNEGSFTIGTIRGSSVSLETGEGTIDINYISSPKVLISSNKGSIQALRIELQNITDSCDLDVKTMEGGITIPLLEAPNIGSCTLSIYSRLGNIDLVLKDFSGLFTVSAKQGEIDIPGSQQCDRANECSGSVNTNSMSESQLSVVADEGNVRIIFV